MFKKPVEYVEIENWSEIFEPGYISYAGEWESGWVAQFPDKLKVSVVVFNRVRGSMKNYLVAIMIAIKKEEESRIVVLGEVGNLPQAKALAMKHWNLIEKNNVFIF